MTNIYLPTIAKRDYNEKLMFFSFIFENLADITNIRKPLENIIEELKSIKGVLKVNYRTNDIGNMVVNPYSFTIVLSYGIGKASVFPVNVLKKAFKDLKSKWGIAASVFLYHIGYYMGNVLGTILKTKNSNLRTYLKRL